MIVSLLSAGEHRRSVNLEGAIDGTWKSRVHRTFPNDDKDFFLMPQGSGSHIQLISLGRGWGTPSVVFLAGHIDTLIG